MGGQIDKADAVIARIASRQHGVVTRAQLLAAGVSVRSIERRLGKGLLIGLHQGVYRVGHRAPNVHASFIAAVFACGDGAVLSGRAAAHLLGILRGRAPAPEVTTRSAHRPEGVAVRRKRLDPREVMRFECIPVTTPSRTLVDLAGTLPVYELGRAVHDAAIRHETSPDEIGVVLDRHRNAKGATALRSILHGDTKTTLSRLEQAFLRLLRANRLPLPTTNKRAGGRYVDCRWPDYRLTVELDSYRYHSSRHAWELDRKREREAYARGDEFRRYTYDDVTRRTRPVLRELRKLFHERY